MGTRVRGLGLRVEGPGIGFRDAGLGLGYMTPIVANQMEKSMEHEMEAVVLYCLSGFRVLVSSVGPIISL